MTGRCPGAAAALLAACALPLLLGFGCGPPAPTRGFVLVSLDTLGAGHLGAYGAERDTSPFFDRLARRGTMFENAFVQYPSTLVSHASIFTGLYPREHGVRRPGQRLAPALETLPERFRAHGFATGAFTEGGFVSASHGFARGFDEFYERPARRLSPDDEVERTFARGLDFLSRLAPDRRFFLFLHTYSIHDPYAPPEPFRSMFIDDPADGGVDSSGRFLRDVYMGRETVGAAEAERLRALYDGSVRYVDSVLERFFAELEELGLAAETTVILTSDHGEEFLQHGSLGHFQAYPETLRVPLLIVDPRLPRARRVPTAVESIDLAPTLLDLAGLPRPNLGSGRSLAPAVRGGELPPGDVFAEVFDQRSQRSLIRRRGDAVFQYLETVPTAESDGTWVTRRASFDLEPEAALEAVAFAESRRVEIVVDGEARGAVDVAGAWVPIALGPASGRRRVTLSTSGCAVPLYLGVGADSRCLSFKLRGAELRREELFDLATDPSARRDLAATRPEIRRDMGRLLAARDWTLRAPPVAGELPAESVEMLRALGYVD